MLYKNRRDVVLYNVIVNLYTHSLPFVFLLIAWYKPKHDADTVI
jgi:hypothetical protein